MLVTSLWTILSITGRHVSLLGALAGRHTGQSFPVVSAMALLIDENGKRYCAIVHEALYDDNPAQHESLMANAQVRKRTGNAIDDASTTAVDTRGFRGTQCCVISGHRVPFYFDGAKCYYKLRPTTPAKAKQLPQLVFTDGRAEYNPIERLHTRRLNATEIDWKKSLCFAPDTVIQKTLEHTTQYVPTVEAET